MTPSQPLQTNARPTPARPGRGPFLEAALCLAALSAGLLGACGGTQAADPGDQTRTEGETVIQAPEGMEGWEHLMGHNNTDKASTRGLNKRRAGPTTLYHKNGVKQGEGAFDALGDEVGPWTYWFDNGVVRWKGTFEEGRVVGVEHAWYDDGSPHYEGETVSGKREGPWKYWHSNGRPMWEGRFQRGQRHGGYVEWNPDGSVNLAESGTYELGVKVADYGPGDGEPAE